MSWRRWIHVVPARLNAIIRTKRVEDDLDDELAFHVAMHAFMVAVALAAFSIPAWRASKTNPMLVLRHE